MVDADPGFATLSDLEAAGRPKVIEPVWEYVRSGAGAERTLRANREAFDRRSLRPHAFADVHAIDLSTQVLGQKVSAPFFVCPTAYQGLVNPEGEAATARAAAGSDVLMVLSSLSSSSIEEVAAAAPGGHRWFQLYLQDHWEKTERLVHRAEKAGFSALVLTVDVPVLGIRDHQAQTGLAMDTMIPLGNGEEFVTPPRSPTPVGGRFELPTYAIVTPKVLDQVRQATHLPLVVKGVLTGEDAQVAVEHGARAVVVSNHGGRQLDGAPATLDALPEVVRAIGTRAEVYLDGGVRRGSDIVMALAMGARAVGLGRPVLWALGAGGEPGISHLFALLKKELANVLALCGRPQVSELDPTMVALR
jgi:4-hydroxymandelate oxidase